MTPKQRFKLKMHVLTIDEAACYLEEEALTYNEEGDRISAAHQLGYADAYRKIAKDLRLEFPEILAS